MENIVMPVFGKKQKKETNLKDQKVTVIMPETDSGKKAGLEIKKKVACYTDNVTVADGNNKTLLDDKTSVFIIAGNLTDNECVKHLYFKSLCITDKRYPGPDGYEVRTIINPFGYEKNILFLGYSDQEGFNKALKVFLEKIDETVPFLKTVSYTNLPIGKDTFNRLAQLKEPDDINLIPSAHVNKWFAKAWLAFATGEQKYADEYIRAWKKLIKFAKQNPDKPDLGNSTRIGMCAHSGAFWIAIHSGIIPSDIQADMEKVLYRWMCSSHGAGHVNRHKDTDAPPHNIVMFSGLACVYLSDYFKKTYGTNETLKKVIKIAHRPFKYFSSGNWRPYCDDSSYSIKVSLPLAIAYSLHEDNHTFVNTSFKKAKQFILSMHTPAGFVPSFGDGAVARIADLISRFYAYYYKDPDIQALCDSEPDENTLYPLGFVLPMRSFTGKKIDYSKTKEDTFEVIPLNKWHYEQALKKSPKNKKVPADKAYDKIHIKKFRSKCSDCKTNWDYFLLDGLGIETHCKNNTIGILDLSINGIPCFVEESGYRWPDRESCSTVTISRNGYSGQTPELAVLEEIKKTEDYVYIKTKVPGFNGVDWVREFFIVYGFGAVINDTFTAYEADNYVFYSHFRIPCVMEQDNTGDITGKRLIKGTDKEYIQKVRTFSAGNVSKAVDFIDIGAKKFENGDMGEPDYKEAKGPSGYDKWEERYGNKDAVVTKYTAFEGADLKKGESVSYTHLLQIKDSKEENAYFDNTKDISVVFPCGGEKTSYKLPFMPGIIKSDETLTTATATRDKKSIEIMSPFISQDTDDFFITEKGNILISKNDSVYLYDYNGNLIFEKTVPGKIRSVSAVDIDNNTFVAVGYDDKNIKVLDNAGNLLWETSVKRQPTMLCSWETKYPKVFSLCFVKYKDTYRLYAGCGDNHVKLFSDNGELVNTIFADYRIIDNLIPYDYDDDGNTEVLAYASEEASSGNIYLYDDQLNVKYRFNAGGWLYTVKSMDYKQIGDKKYFAAGVTTNETFLLFEMTEEGKVDRIFGKTVSGANTAVYIDKKSKLVYSGSDKGYLKAFDLKGNEVYSTYVGMQVNKLVKHNEKIYAVGKSKIKEIDSGKVNRIINSPTVIKDVITKGDEVFIACENGIIKL